MHGTLGRIYNPILAVDVPKSASLVELFRPDFLVPIGDDPALEAFLGKFPHLINPLFPKQLFFRGSHGGEGQARLLDMHNLIHHFQDTVEWGTLLNVGFRVPRWAPEDPLADVFLAEFGGFPDPEDVGFDYEDFVSLTTSAIDIEIGPKDILPADVLDYPNFAYLNKYQLEPHHTSHPNWIYPGLYLGHLRVALI